MVFYFFVLFGISDIINLCSIEYINEEGGFDLIKTIKLKLDAIEGMLYYWQATSEKEKVGESYLVNITEFPGMDRLYGDDFTPESARKVLSAISNREMLNDSSKTERKFWNNNMWMLEDLEYTNTMVAPLKVLNLDDLVEKINSSVSDSKYEDIEVIFIPGHKEESYIDGNKVVINFFRVMPDIYGGDSVKIGEKELKSYIEEKIIEAVS